MSVTFFSDILIEGSTPMGREQFLAFKPVPRCLIYEAHLKEYCTP